MIDSSNWLVLPGDYDIVFGTGAGRFERHTSQRPAGRAGTSIAKRTRRRITVSTGAITLRRLKEGMERFLITDINNPAGGAKAQSNVRHHVGHESVGHWARSMPEAAASFNHVPGGSNVLFMDGHVEFGRYPQPDGSQVLHADEGLPVGQQPALAVDP